MKRKTAPKLHVITSALLVFILLIASFFNFSFLMHAKEEKTKRIIKVGYPSQSEMVIKDEDGIYSGYLYDYLMALSSYTDWEYEFIAVSKTADKTQEEEMLKLLQEGHIDLAGGFFNKDQDTEMLYSANPYGTFNQILGTAEKNDNIDTSTLKTIKPLKVALAKDAEETNQCFRQYAKSNGLDYQVQYYKDSSVQWKAVKDGKADVFAVDDTFTQETYRVITSYAPRFVYFGMSAKASDFMYELNLGMKKLAEAEPDMESYLHDVYTVNQDHKAVFNQQEKQFIAKQKPLKVLFLDDEAPLQYTQNKQIVGACKDVLNEISSISNLKFTYASVHTYEDYIEYIKTGKADILAAVNHDCFLDQNTIRLTNDYLKVSMQTVMNKKINSVDTKKYIRAARKQYKETLAKLSIADKIRYYETLQDCLDAIEKGEADYCIDSSYLMSYYLNQGTYTNLISFQSTSQVKIPYSFALTPGSDTMLINILNKSIQSLSQEKIYAYVYQHQVEKKNVTLQQYIKTNPMTSIIVMLVIFGSILAICTIGYIRQRYLKHLFEVENRKYHMLEKLTGEIVFEYDYVQDRLKLNNQNSQFSQDAAIEHYTKKRIEGQKTEEDSEKTLLFCIMEKKDTDQDVLLHLQNGEHHWYHLSMKVVRDKDRVLYAIGKISDIQDEILEKEQLQKESKTDALTGIWNAAAIRMLIQKALDETQQPYAMGVLDLDYFKQVNDEYGHFIGDQVLKKSVVMLREAFGEKALLGRLGGDEFVVYLPEIQQREEVLQKCQRMLQLFCEKDEKLPSFTLSMGFVIGNKACEFDELYQQSDKVLYEVKAHGRGHYRIKNMT